MIVVNGFRQSQVLPPIEQRYYTAARQFLKDNGMRRYTEYFVAAIAAEETELPFSHHRFIEILWLAQADYITIIFNHDN